jgi:serine protease Do
MAIQPVDGRRFQAARAAVVRVVASGASVGEAPVQARRAGLGFVVDPNGYVMTSERLVRGARSVAIELAGGQRLPVTQIGRDPYFEVAVLKVDVRALPYVALGESETLKVGDSVVAIGSPEGRESADTLLHVTSTGAATGGDLATDAPIPSQAVGGPVVNSHGHAIGIASASEPPGARTGGSIGRAVPIDRAKSILRDLQSNMVQRARRPEPPSSDASSR